MMAKYAFFITKKQARMLGSDGLPIEIGDTVWLSDEHACMAGKSPEETLDECGLVGVMPSDALTVYDVWTDGAAFFFGGWCPASWLAHAPPDTQGRIEKDALKSDVAYWGCAGISCADCPATVNGKKPDERYGTQGCFEAQKLDLLRRQRELDAREAGRWAGI